MQKDIEMPHNITPLMLKLKALADIGYNSEFVFTDEGLLCVKNNRVYKPSEIQIQDHFRFEGITNPEDMSILYTVETNDGIKGTIVDAYGPYANTDLMDFMKQVQDHTIEHL